jgi:CheY-like chemotaxis protein
MNLCLNAADALHGQGRLTLQLDNLPPSPAAPEQVCLTVRDNGAGMRPEVLERAFEPFFTTKPAGKGTGLGLAMVFGTVKSHGGEVALESGVGEGTTVTVRLPALPAAAEAAQRRRATTGVGAPSERDAPVDRHVLVVDDEPLIRRSLRRILSGLGYEVTTAENGAEAVAIYQERKDEICLVLLDMAMPVMDGAECFRRLRQLDPGVKVLVASGYSAAHNATEVTAAAGFLRKPFDADELEAAVHAIVEGRAVTSGGE